MITIKVDSSQVVDSLTYVAKEQLPFAGARALTWTAQDAQDAVRRELDKDFMLRNNFVKQGIRIEPASKENLRARIYTRSDGKFSIDFMVRQEEGGEKTPTHGQNLAIPASSKGTTYVRQGENSRGVIRRDMKPRALLDNKQEYFKGTVHGVYGIWKRTGQKDSKGWPRPHVNLMYVLKHEATVKPRFNFMPTVQQTVQERFERNFELSFKDAVGSNKLAKF